MAETYTRTYTWVVNSSSSNVQVRPSVEHPDGGTWGTQTLTDNTAWLSAKSNNGGIWYNYLTVSGDQTHIPYHITGIECSAFFHHGNDSGSDVRYFLIGNNGNAKWSGPAKEWVSSDERYTTGETAVAGSYIENINGDFLNNFYGIAIYCSASNMYVKIDSGHYVRVTFTFTAVPGVYYWNSANQWAEANVYYRNSANQWALASVNYDNSINNWAEA